MSWNHNTHYHGIVLDAIPADCRRALDVGCGRGVLARKLASRCREVIAIDSDPKCITRAKTSAWLPNNISFFNGDVMREPLSAESFDFIVAVATLHHLPLRAAVERFRELLRPAGVLVVVGLYRITTPLDYAFSAVALPISWIIRRVVGEEEVGAPLQEPAETLRTIRKQCHALMPGAVLRRRFFFRYTLIWRKR